MSAAAIASSGREGWPGASAPSPFDYTLPGRLLRRCEEAPQGIALREKRLGIWQELSWADYVHATAATARALWELGLRSGDHTAILSNNRTEWLFADLGAQTLGLRSVGVYETNPPEDVAYILAHCEARVVFCEDQEQVDKAIAMREKTPSVQHVVVFDPRGTRHYDDPRLVRWSDFLAEGERALGGDPSWFEQRVAELDPHAPAMVVYTSGTTGSPKGALLSGYNVTANADSTAGLLGVRRDDTLLSYLPLCHVAEKIFSLYLPLTVGSIVHFGESIATVQSDLREVSPTVFLGVPRIWEKIHTTVSVKLEDASWLKRRLAHRYLALGRSVSGRQLAKRPDFADRLRWLIGDLLFYRPLQERLGLRRCRLPISGAAPISPELLEWFHAIGVHILEGYGMTECSGASHINPPDAPRLGSVGRALPYVECTTDEQGEILVRGPNVFHGYLHDEAATREAVDEDGWLHTGDVGEIGDDGFLRITGRKKEIIVTSGGKNLSPERIENVMKTSPYIKELVAIGDRRKFIGALVQVNEETVGDWANRRGIQFTSYEDLAARPEVRDLVSEEIDRLNELLPRVEQIKAFRIFPKQLHQDDGELTATQKVRRGKVQRIYEELIESMYGGGR